jgi:hypothetical protein
MEQLWLESLPQEPLPQVQWLHLLQAQLPQVQSQLL